MISKKFHEKILGAINEGEVVKKKRAAAIELYLKEEVTLLESNDEYLLYTLDGKKVKIMNKDIGLTSNVDGSYSSRNEYAFACMLAYKRDYYIENGKQFSSNDVISHNSYYYYTSINSMNYEDYKLRFVFYYGLIDKLVKIGKVKDAIKMMIDFFCFMEEKISYDRNVNNYEPIDQYNIVRNRINLFVENAEIVPSLFDTVSYSILTLGKLMYIIAINNPYILKNKGLEAIYKYIFSFCTKKQKNVELYELLVLQANIIKWYNKELDDDFMRENIASYDVLYCYLNYLDENKKYEEIREIYNKNRFRYNAPIIFAIGINSFYTNGDYDSAVNILLKMENITFKSYKNLKEKFPNLFSEQYIKRIIEHIADTASCQEAREIIKYENKEEYCLIVDSRENFKSFDENLNEYLGKYDDILLKIYQKEVTNRVGSIRGYRSSVPEELLDLFEKMQKMKNGKYYVAYIIYDIIVKNWLLYDDALEEYSKGLKI